MGHGLQHANQHPVDSPQRLWNNLNKLFYHDLTEKKSMFCTTINCNFQSAGNEIIIENQNFGKEKTRQMTGFNEGILGRVSV